MGYVHSDVEYATKVCIRTYLFLRVFRKLLLNGQTLIKTKSVNTSSQKYLQLPVTRCLCLVCWGPLFWVPFVWVRDKISKVCLGPVCSGPRKIYSKKSRVSLYPGSFPLWQAFAKNCPLSPLPKNSFCGSISRKGSRWVWGHILGTLFLGGVYSLTPPQAELSRKLGKF